MKHQTTLSVKDLESLAELDTCTVSNAIERLNVRLRNEGFTHGTAQCQFANLGSMVGYAATGRIRTASPPMAFRCYHDRLDWWSYVASLPEPRVIVLQDVEPTPGLGAFIGEIHAAIARALKCLGCVTNGAVRDLPAIEALGFKLFAGSVAVSHAYAHIIEFGEPVEIGGLKIKSGDLIHGDRHGVLNIPLDVAGAIPGEAAKVLKEEADLLRFCASAQFSLEGLQKRISSVNNDCDMPWRSR